MRAQEVCRQGRWQPVAQDLGQPEMSTLLDMRDSPDLNPSPDMTDMRRELDAAPDLPDLADLPDMMDMSVADMPPDMMVTCACAADQVCIAGRCATRLRVPNPNTTARARFGTSVAVHGDWLAVGAPGVGRVKGKTYLFNRVAGAWKLEETLEGESSPLFGADAGFGSAVALSSMRLVVGSPFDSRQLSSVDEGAVYIYELNGTRWRLVERVFDPSPNKGDRFGASVAVNGSEILAGSPGDDLFNRSNVGKAVKFTCFSGSRCTSSNYAGVSADARAEAQVGAQVAFLPGGRGAFSAPLDSTVVPQGGSLKIWGALSQADGMATFISPQGLEAKERFGAAISTDMSMLAVGAPGRPFQQSEEVGRVYVYDAMRLTQAPQIIETPGVGAAQRFGAAVAVREGLVVAGAPGALRAQGQAHVFSKGAMGFDYDQALTADASFGGEFGAAVAFDAMGELLVIGAPAEEARGNAEVGGVYIYTFDPKPTP